MMSNQSDYKLMDRESFLAMCMDKAEADDFNLYEVRTTFNIDEKLPTFPIVYTRLVKLVPAHSTKNYKSHERFITIARCSDPRVYIEAFRVFYNATQDRINKIYRNIQ